MASLGRDGTVIDDKQVLVVASVYNPTESDVPVCPEAAPQSTGGAPYYPADPINHHTNENTNSVPSAYTPSYAWQGPAPPVDRAPVYAFDPAIVQSQYPGNPQVIQTQPGDFPHYIDSSTDFGGIVMLACFTAWCCCLCLGVASYFTAVHGRKLEEEGKVEEARAKAETSKCLSAGGIVVGVIILTCVILRYTHVI